MTNHQASEQMLGYIYQIRYALYLLMKNKDEEANISIEKFDDVSFTKPDGTENTLIQLKHHTKKYGNLTNSSNDLWRTLNAWINEVNKDTFLLRNTKFLIITTAQSPENSASSLLKTNPNNRNPVKAFELLSEVANKSINKTQETYYKNFLRNAENLSKELIRNVYVIDNSHSITDTAKEIKRELMFSCKPQHLNSVYERLEGWWTNKAIDALSSLEPVYVNTRQVATTILDISQEYRDDNLPIDIDELSSDLDSDSFKERIFYEQLKLIGTGNYKLKLAVRDYYRAFNQRASWVRNDLLYINELDNYEMRLVDEWNYLYANMLEKIDDLGNDEDEEVTVRLGKELLRGIEQKDYRIRERCSAPFIMRGSYHILSDELKVGWHHNFNERLKHLLESRVESSE